MAGRLVAGAEVGALGGAADAEARGGQAGALQASALQRVAPV